MPYELKNRANHAVEVQAELDAEAVAKERRQIVATFRGRAAIPGFRQGKAPEAAVRARFAADIESELKEHLMNMLLRELLDGEEGIELVSAPQLQDMAFADDGSFRFTAEMEIRPTYELPDVSAVELPEFSLEVSDAEIESELQRVADENASWEPADDAKAEDGMLVEADLYGEMEDSDEEPYREESARFVVGHDSIPPEISEALQGAEAGDRRMAEKRFPDDDSNEDRAGKVVRYSIVVKSLKRKSLPQIDDDLAKTIGLDSLEELTNRVRDVLTHGKRGERREAQRRAVLDHLQAALDVGELPSSLVQSSVREDLNRFAYTMAMQGAGTEVDDMNWQELAAKVEPASRQRVLDNLVLEQLAGEWEVPVPEADLDTHISMEAQRLGLPPGEHKANLAKEGKLDELRHSARISATIDEMIRRAGGGDE